MEPNVTIICACEAEFSDDRSYYEHCTTCSEVPNAPQPE